jgi:hypothetical protein
MPAPSGLPPACRYAGAARDRSLEKFRDDASNRLRNLRMLGKPKHRAPRPIFMNHVFIAAIAAASEICEKKPNMPSGRNSAHGLLSALKLVF